MSHSGRTVRSHNGSGRPDSRPSSRSRMRLDHVSQDDSSNLTPPPPHPSSAHTAHTPVAVTEALPPSILFRSRSHGNKTLAVLNDLRLNSELCDIVLRVGSEKISSHKIILGANSPYFRAMFSSSYSESSQSVVEIHGIEFSALEALVQYFYTSKIHISTANVQELLAASCMLQVSGTMDACCEFMRRHLGASNCLGVRTFADMLSCSELKKVADNFAKRNFSTVVESEDFLKLAVDQVLELFSADDLSVDSEEKVFEALVKWIKYDPARREKFIVDLLEKVRLPLLSPAYLFDHVIKVGVVKENLHAVLFVTESMEYLLLPERRESKQSSDWAKPRRSKTNVQMILAVGGVGRREPAGTPSIELYDPSTKQWRILSQMASGRWGAGLIAMTTREDEEVVYLLGGSNESSRLSSVQSYSLSNEHWTSVEDMSSARNGVGVVCYEGLLYAIGGFNGVSPLKSMEKYDPVTNHWTPLPDMTSNRFGLGACACGGMIYAIGGQDSSILNTAECYNISTKTWTPISPMSVCRKFPGVECLSKKIYAIGGVDAAGSRFVSVEEYVPALNQWVGVSPLLGPRSGMGTAVLGGHIYIIGGHDGSSPLLSMERYDPLVNEWTAQPHMTVSRDCVGVAVVNVFQDNKSAGNGISRTSPPGGSDSPILHSNV